MRSWRFKVKFKPMNGGNDNKTNTDRKAVIQAMTHTQCYGIGWRIIGALNLPRASSRQLCHNGKSICEERGISEKFKFKQDF